MLETVELPGSSRLTTRLGFGGSGLMGGLSERESLRLLETAYDAGIRHFDVAPSYGHGMAERCLGKFLRGKSDDVTVTTKYGIAPPRKAGLFGLARSVARPIVKKLPAVRRRLASAAAGMTAKAPFSAEEALKSLEHSLRELGRDRVDLFLMHEAEADDLASPDLLSGLQAAQEQGRIGSYGIGSERTRVEGVWGEHRQFCKALQFECSVLATAPQFPGAFCIHHRTVSGALGLIRNLFEREPEVCRAWSEAADADLASSAILAGLLLTAALQSRRSAMVLFSSRVPAHIQTNAEMAGNPQWTGRAQRLRELIAGMPALSV